MAPGIFLSQPTIVTTPSYHWALTTFSILSAIMSRLGRLLRIPSVPMLMPSLTPMVWKISPIRSSSCTPCLTTFARSFRCILQGLPSQPVLAIPICALFRSSRVRPMACSMAWAAGRLGSWVIVRLYLFSAFINGLGYKFYNSV